MVIWPRGLYIYFGLTDEESLSAKHLGIFHPDDKYIIADIEGYSFLLKVCPWAIGSGFIICFILNK